VLSCARGEPLVEMVANDPGAQTLRFFLIRFHPSCEPSCNSPDLATATIESSWSSYTIYDDATIANTTLDLLQLPPVRRSTTKSLLRMQELQNPWGPLVLPGAPESCRFVNDFRRRIRRGLRRDPVPETVYGTRRSRCRTSRRNNGFGTQPNAFDTLKITTSSPRAGDPTLGTVLRECRRRQGDPAAYFTNRLRSDRAGRRDHAYKNTVAGASPRDQMPTSRERSWTPHLADMSIRRRPPRRNGILVHMCQMCHTRRSISRYARAVHVEQLARCRGWRGTSTIARLQLPAADRHLMPPSRFHELSPAAAAGSRAEDARSCAYAK